jgi:hypothetical protein
MPTFAELEAIRNKPEPAYPEYDQLNATARQQSRFADPARIRDYEQVIREHSRDWCSAVLGYPFPGTLHGLPIVDAELLRLAHEAGLDPPLPKRIVVWKLEDAARRAELDEQRAATLQRDRDRSAAALAACQVPVEKRANTRGRRLGAGINTGPLVHVVPLADAVSGRSRRHPAARALCERPGRAKPRVLGEPTDDPATCVSCLDYAPKIRTTGEEGRVMRWGVFVRDPRDGIGWEERHRWIDGNLAELTSQTDAENRAAEVRQLHPEWDVEARLTDDPLPGTFRETFAPLLPTRGELP